MDGHRPYVFTRLQSKDPLRLQTVREDTANIQHLPIEVRWVKSHTSSTVLILRLYCFVPRISGLVTAGFQSVSTVSPPAYISNIREEVEKCISLLTLSCSGRQ